MFEDKELNERIDKIASKALGEISSNGKISPESCIKLDEAMAEMITQAINSNKELGILLKNDINIIKKSRAFLMENPGKGDEDPWRSETALIMYTYITAIEILNEEEEE